MSASRPARVQNPGVRGVAIVLAMLHLLPLLTGVLWGQAGFFWALLGVGLIVASGIVIPHGLLFGRARCSFPQPGKCIHLTIDDGPCADTPEVLDLLDSHQARAVFFLIGKKVEANPALARAIVDRGHVIGNHTWSHPAGTFWAAFPSRLRREISATQAILAKETGRTAGWFRAPAGLLNPFMPAVVEEYGLRILGWNARGFDAVRTDVDAIVRRILRGLRPGGIILLHQGHPHSLEVLGRVLDALRSGGWQLVVPQSPQQMCRLKPDGEKPPASC